MRSLLNCHATAQQPSPTPSYSPPESCPRLIQDRCYDPILNCAHCSHCCCWPYGYNVVAAREPAHGCGAAHDDSIGGDGGSAIVEAKTAPGTDVYGRRRGVDSASSLRAGSQSKLKMLDSVLRSEEFIEPCCEHASYCLFKCSASTFGIG